MHPARPVETAQAAQHAATDAQDRLGVREARAACARLPLRVQRRAEPLHDKQLERACAVAVAVAVTERVLAVPDESGVAGDATQLTEDLGLA